MKKNIKVLLIGMMAILMLFVSCSKDGETESGEKIYTVYLAVEKMVEEKKIQLIKVMMFI